MRRTTRAHGRHHTTARWRLLDVLAVALSTAFLALGVMIAMGPDGSSSPEEDVPVPEISTKAPASVTVTR